MSCIVKKLKGATGFDTLPMLDALDITIPANLSSGILRIAASEANKVQIIIPSGVTVGNYSSGDYLEPSTVNPKLTIINSYATAQTIRLKNITYLAWLGGSSLTGLTAKFTTNIFKSGNWYGFICGDDFLSTGVSGVLSDFGNNVNIQYIYVSGVSASITGTVESLIAKFISKGKTSGSVMFMPGNSAAFTMAGEKASNWKTKWSTAASYDTLAWAPSGSNYAITWQDVAIETIDASGNIVS